MKDIPIYGGDKRVDAVTDIVKEGQFIKIGSLEAECLHTPCHTTGHICYVVGTLGKREAVFTGIFQNFSNIYRQKFLLFTEIYHLLFICHYKGKYRSETLKLTWLMRVSFFS